MWHAQTMGWLKAWRRRNSAWGAWLGEQHILLAALALQATGSVRVTVFEHQHAPLGLVPPHERDSWMVQHLRAASAQLPRHERTLALALQDARCCQGLYPAAPGLSPRQLVAEVQLEAAQALGVAPHEVGFDFGPQTDTDAAAPAVPWAACRRPDLQLWRAHARRAGWRLPVVEPEQQAARRAACCLRGDALAHGAQSPQDWQFESHPLRALGDADWQTLRSSAQWGHLVACGAALGLMA